MGILRQCYLKYVVSSHDTGQKNPSMDVATVAT